MAVGTGSPLAHSERVAVARLHALLELLPAALDKQLAPVRLTAFEFVLIQSLHETEGRRMRLGALASRTNATLARLSRVVTGLERKGLVQRAPCAEDGRAINAVLTDAGEDVYQEASGRYADAVRAMILDGLDAHDVEDLARLAYAILARLDPGARMAVTAEGTPICDADPAPCSADPAPVG